MEGFNLNHATAQGHQVLGIKVSILLQKLGGRLGSCPWKKTARKQLQGMTHGFKCIYSNVQSMGDKQDEFHFFTTGKQI